MAEAKKELIGELKLLDVILSFDDLFEKAKDRKGDDGNIIKGKFKANFLMKKDTPGTIANMAKAKKASTEAKVAKWGADEKKHPKLKPNLVYLRDGDLENWEGYDGHFYVSANSDEQPVLIDRIKDENGKWIELTADNGGRKKLYAGARVNAIVRVWAQDNEHGKRVNAEVKCVQFVGHGTPFSGKKAVDPNESFGDDDVGPDDLDVEQGGIDASEDDGGLV